MLTITAQNERATAYTCTVPREGKTQLLLLQLDGCEPCDHVLEIGCGALVAGIPIMHFLDAKHYVGIEPNQWLIEQSASVPANAQIMQKKQPRFLHNTEFDARELKQPFDYIISHSILSHAAYWQLPLYLKNCHAVMNPSKGGKVLA